MECYSKCRAQEASPSQMGKAEVGVHTLAFPLTLAGPPCAWQPFQEAQGSQGPVDPGGLN